MLSKIFEKVIYNRLFDHLHSNVILNEHQYGFRSEILTKYASYTLLNEMLTSLNNKQIVGGIFCDLHQSCHSTREHEILWSIRKILQFDKVLFRWKISKVILSHNNGIESTWEKIKQGVPHGSIVGHIFFPIYINDLPNLASIKNKILLYADNTSIIVTSTNLKNFETRIDKIFGVINNWFKVTQLILNYNKTHSLQFNKIIAGIMI